MTDISLEAIGLFIEFEDVNYAFHLKPLLGGRRTFVIDKPIETIAQIEIWAKKRNITSIILTQTDIIKKLLNLHSMRKQPSLDDYAGSLIKRNEIEYLVVPPLKHLITVKYGKFLFKHLLSKLFEPQRWRNPPDFKWEMFDPEKAELLSSSMENAIVVGVDSETTMPPYDDDYVPRIKCVSYCIIHEDFTHTTFVVPCDSSYNLAWIRRFNQSRAPKILQNGKYDCAFFFRFNCPLRNYLFDTINAFHCWYAELPKDLGFIGCFFIRNNLFWKDLAHTGNQSEFYEYACRDPWVTAYSFLFWLLDSPDWSKRNYLFEFPAVPVNHFLEMLGVKWDLPRLAEVKAIQDKKNEEETAKLSRMLGTVNFNPRSPKQMLQLLAILGFKDAKSAKESELKKYMYAHPLNERLLETCLRIVKTRKEISTYLVEAKAWRGRILFTINGHGTDTFRSTSREHCYGCGFNIQNVTRDGENSFVKETIIADPGFRFVEVDEKQAETFDTAYISGDPALIADINSDQDFHSRNAAAFFGKKYEEIWDIIKGKTKDKVLRDLSKRTNHGANYLMGDSVLLDTMGPKMVRQAQKFIGLPSNFKLLQITHFLLEQFHAKYKTFRTVYHPAVIAEVEITHMLTGALGWIRYCFGNPRKNKPDLNGYVAHKSQSLNAERLNKATIRIFYEVQMNPKFAPNLRMIAHIHDSNFFQVRIGHEYIIDEIKSRMEIPVTVKGADGVIRTYTVPCDVKSGKDGKPAFRWSDTE